MVDAVTGVIEFPVEFEDEIIWLNEKGEEQSMWAVISATPEIDYEAEREDNRGDWWIDYTVSSILNIEVINEEGDDVDIPDEGPFLDALVSIIDRNVLVSRQDDVKFKCNQDAFEVARS